MSDFFTDHFGNARSYNGTRSAYLGRLLDAWGDASLVLSPTMRRLRKKGNALRTQRVLVVGVQVPERGEALDRVISQLAESRHTVITSTVRMKEIGKFENVQVAVEAASAPLSSFDWLVITDDDIELPRNFLDIYLALAAETDLVLSQPAHRFGSYTTYDVTQRRIGSLVRRTGFVEIGPLTIVRRDGFDALLPFPPSRWCYGIDVLWADTARRRGWTIGVVDAVPIRHTKPVGGGYSLDTARSEGRDLLERYGIELNRRDLLADLPQDGIRKRLGRNNKTV